MAKVPSKIQVSDELTIHKMNGKQKVVARNISVDFPSGVSVGLLGRNGAGKTTMLKMIAGTDRPTSGTITSTGSISYPVGFGGSFHPDLTAAQNTRFVARIYGVDTDALEDFVRDFAELGVHYDLPVRTYSAGMRARLAFGVSMGIPFDTYLVDEVTAVGDIRFRKKSDAVFRARMEGAGAIVVNHSAAAIRQLCEMVGVLEDGNLTLYEDMEEGFAAYESRALATP